MAVGFNSTWGSGTTDLIKTAYASSASIKTIAGFYRIRSLVALMRIFSKPGDINLYYSTADGGRWEFVTGWTTTGGSWHYSGGLSTNTWYHFAIVMDGTSTANNPSVYIDASLQTITEFSTPAGTHPTTSTNPVDWGNVAALNRTFDGALKHCAVWHGALSAADISALSNGVSPLLIRPDILVSELELEKTSRAGIDRFAGPATVTGTADYGGDIIIRPSAQILQFPPTAAASGFSPYWAAGSNVIMNNGSP